MATSQHRQDIYKTRREIIKKHLKHGDIKLLAEKLILKYPDVTQSNTRDYANYLSQVFNSRSSRPFKDELARQIESVWDTLENRDLDNFTAQQEYELAVEQGHDDIWSERLLKAQEIEYKNDVKQKADLAAGYKEDSKLPIVFIEALHWRIHQKYPNAEIRTNEVLQLKSGDYLADIIVTNGYDSVPLAIIEITDFKSGFGILKKMNNVKTLLRESGTDQGFLAMRHGDELELIPADLDKKNSLLSL